MKITDFLNAEVVKIGLESRGKKEVIEELVDQLVSAKKIKKNMRNDIVNALMEREALGSTGIGQGIAIPHAKSSKINNLVAAFGTSKKGVEFQSLDSEPVNVIFLLVAPTNSTGLHLKALAKISKILKNKFIRQSLRDAGKPEEIMKTLKREDE